jgi:hypothetical protein
VRAAESQPSVSNILGLLALTVAIPYLSRISDELIAKDQGAYKTMWVVAFVTNLLAVALPGRFDSKVANGEPSRGTTCLSQQHGHSRFGRSSISLSWQ